MIGRNRQGTALKVSPTPIIIGACENQRPSAGLAQPAARCCGTTKRLADREDIIRVSNFKPAATRLPIDAARRRRHRRPGNLQGATLKCQWADIGAG